jgi:manganese/iron transport system permease protein/iron/zinc/copper transport system permease protein
VTLTKAGRQEALRILRAHRLWEVYLDHVGTPADEVHTRAEKLEHMHDASAVEYLDDLLGHPEKDPHGQEIPEDEACRLPDARVPLSYLRRGRTGIVDRVPSKAAQSGLVPGDRIRMAPRRDNGRIWVAVRDDDREFTLDHAAADAIQVRCG